MTARKNIKQAMHVPKFYARLLNTIALFRAG